MPWMVRLSGLSTGLLTQRLVVWFLVRAMPGSQARSPIGGVWEATDWCIPQTLMFLAISFSLLSPLKINKIFKKRKRNLRLKTQDSAFCSPHALQQKQWCIALKKQCTKKNKRPQNMLNFWLREWSQLKKNARTAKRQVVFSDSFYL